MKVILLGGAGDVGRTAAREVVRSAEVNELVLADRDAGAAEAAVREIAAYATEGGPRVDFAGADAADAGTLAELFAGADVVLNTTGPFYKLGVGVLRAAVTADCHYLDVCDDPEPTVEMLALDAEAREAGVTALAGLGASPGASNLLAALAVRGLDEVESLYTAWPVDVPHEWEELNEAGEPQEEDLMKDGVPSAATVHWMHQISGHVAVHRGGRQEERPLRGVELDYPGLGTGTAYTVGHPEPLTLGPNLGVEGGCACLMVAFPGTLAFLEGLREDIDAGKLSEVEAAREVAAPPLKRVMRAGLKQRRFPSPGKLPPFFALATGRRNGRGLSIGARMNSMPRGMAAMTGLPLAIGLRQLLEGRLRVGAGVHPPELALDPERFFSALAPHCASPEDRWDQLVQIDHTEAARPA